MSMTIDNEPQDERDEGTPEPLQQQPPITKGALATLGMDALDRNRVGQVKVSATAGGVAFATAIEVMEFSKLMSIADQAVPKHLRNNPGMCLAVTFQAVEWRMSPFAVAGQSFVVNDRIAYQSQLVHAVIEARAPLRERLDCRYEGEGPEQKCIVIGKFRDGTTREYESPMFKDIKTKNSPLWLSDVRQQLFYFSSRSWARKWCPDVLLGIYTKEEMAELPQDENRQIEGATLRDRIAGTKEGEEGHRNGHAEAELANVAADKGTITPAGEPTTIKPAKTDAKPKAEPKKPADKKPTAAEKKKAEQAAAAKAAAERAADRAQATSDKNKAKQQSAEPPAAKVPTEPKNEAEYQVYAIHWIEKVGDPEKALDRWAAERAMRERCGVRTAMKNDLRFRIENKHGV